MKRYLPSLNLLAKKTEDASHELYLVQVERVRYRYRFQKPYFQISLLVLGPRESAGKLLPDRLHCTPRALWKLRWFLKELDITRN